MLSATLMSRDATTTLYKICEVAVHVAGARNAMILHFNDNLGYMTLRAGYGADWTPELLGEKVNVADQENAGITAYVAATGETFISPDVSEESRYKVLIPGSKSELAVPIHDKHGRVRGVMNAESNQIDRFGDDEKNKLEALALIAALSLDREDSHVREEALVEVGTALDVARTEAELLKRVAEVTQRVMRVTAYSIFLWDETEGAFTLRDTVGSSTLSKNAKYPPGVGCTGWVCQHGESIRLDEPNKDVRWIGKYLEFPMEEIQSYIAVPILSGGRCMGCMRALRKRAKNPFVDIRFTEDDEILLMAIAEQLGTGLEKLRSVRRLVNSERMAAWGELSARNSHMIGNRVFALRGDLNELRYVLNEEPISRENALEIVESLEGGVRRLEEILQDFRDFVTATKLNLVEANIAEVVTSAATSVIPHSSPIALVLIVSDEIEPFFLDTKKIERAISELVENATHFMQEGKVSVTVRRADDIDLDDARIKRRGAEYAKIVVEDEGPGVDASSKNRIFDAYRTSRVKGMGLGLSIVKGIVDAHDGTVYENGEPGKGARFVILLPIRHQVEQG